MTRGEKIFWTVLYLLIMAVPVFGQEILNETTVRDGNTLTIYSGEQFFEGYDGWYEINRNIYTRGTPTDSGYKRGVWTDRNILELPDSLNASKFIKISDRDGNFFAFRPVGFARYVGGEVDIANVIKFANTLNGVSAAGNTLTYSWGTGSTLKLKYTGGTIKQELNISTIDRRKAIQLVPTASHIGIVYEYAKAGEKYQIAVDAGTAWTADSTMYPVYDLMKVYSGKNYWLSGVTWNAFRDTLGHPGMFTIDPTVIFNYNDSEDDPMTQGSPTTNYGGLDQIHMRGDSAGNDMLNGWIRFDIDSVAFTDSVSSAKLFLTSKQANFGGSVTYSVHLVKVGLPVEAQITWNIWKTSNNWNLAGARGGNDIYYSSPSPVTGHSFNAAGGGEADSVDITTLVRKIAGKDSSLANYGFILLTTTRGNGNTIYYASSEYATASYRPYLRVEIAEPPANVYAADSLAFSTLTDSTAKLDSIAGNPLDVSTGNVFAIYDSSIGMFRDTSQTAPFKKAKTTYAKSA